MSTYTNTTELFGIGTSSWDADGEEHIWTDRGFSIESGFSRSSTASLADEALYGGMPEADSFGAEQLDAALSCDGEYLARIVRQGLDVALERCVSEEDKLAAVKTVISFLAEQGREDVLEFRTLRNKITGIAEDLGFFAGMALVAALPQEHMVFDAETGLGTVTDFVPSLRSKLAHTVLGDLDVREDDIQAARGEALAAEEALPGIPRFKSAAQKAAERKAKASRARKSPSNRRRHKRG